MGKVLILCAGEQERWQWPVPKQTLEVDGEKLLGRTIRQIRQRMNNYPHIVSHQKCLRSYSPNYINPSAHRWISETLLSVSLIWGSDWTMVLLGDVFYTDGLIATLYTQRAAFSYRFYGNSSDILALTFTSSPPLKHALLTVVKAASEGRHLGKLWDLYFHLGNNSEQSATQFDKEHFAYISDDSQDFDTMEQYQRWTKTHSKLPTTTKGV